MTNFTIVFLDVFYKRFLIGERKRRGCSQPWHLQEFSKGACLLYGTAEDGTRCFSGQERPCRAGTCSAEEAAKASQQGKN